MHLLPSLPSALPSVPSSLPSLLTAKSIAVGVVVVAILAGGAAEAAGLLGASAEVGASSATMLETTLIDLTERSAVIDGATSLESNASAHLLGQTEVSTGVQADTAVRAEATDREDSGASLRTTPETEAGAEVDTAAEVVTRSDAVGEVIFDLATSGDVSATGRGMLTITLR